MPVSAGGLQGVLGYTTEGLIMLLITVLTCGVAGIVFGVIGLVEGIIYLTKSDDDFYRLNTKGSGVEWTFFAFEWNLKTPFFSVPSMTTSRPISTCSSACSG